MSGYTHISRLRMPSPVPQFRFVSLRLINTTTPTTLPTSPLLFCSPSFPPPSLLNLSRCVNSPSFNLHLLHRHSLGIFFNTTSIHIYFNTVSLIYPPSPCKSTPLPRSSRSPAPPWRNPAAQLKSTSPSHPPPPPSIARRHLFPSLTLPPQHSRRLHLIPRTRPQSLHRQRLGLPLQLQHQPPQ